MKKSILMMLLSVAVFSTAHAGVITTNGTITQSAIPADLRNGALSSDTTIFLFAEQSNVTLANPLNVNFASAGFYTPAVTNSAASIPLAAGTSVDSYLFHADINFTGTQISFLGSVTFDTDILGIITSTGDLISTDSLLGMVGTNYGSVAGRGIEGQDFPTIAAQDQILVSADLRTITLALGLGGALDNIRVVVAASAVPEPSTYVLFLLGGLMLFSLKKLRKTS